MILRPYQEEAVVGLFTFFMENDEGNPLVALPTGTGKSYVIAEFVRRAVQCYPKTRILIVTHVKELVEQNHAELLKVWPSAPAGICSSGLKRFDTHLPIVFCGIGSIIKRLPAFGFVDLVIVDEAHTISPKGSTQYAKVFEALRQVNPRLRVIGLTATPYRLGLGNLTDGDLFTAHSTDYCSLEKFNELVDGGFISPLIPKKMAVELDVDSVGVTGGEFNADELQAAVDKASVTNAALDEALKLCGGRKHWLVFCTGTEHAEHVAARLRELGVPACTVHSKMPDSERDMRLDAFRAGKFTALVGVGIFTTGFNFKPVDCIIVLRPTMSPVLWVQMLGRGTRPSPETGKVNCLVLDFAANTRRLGPINDPTPPRKKGQQGSGSPPFKICPACDTYCHTRARFCVSCGAAFPEVVKVTSSASGDELIRREKKPKEEKPPAPPEPLPVTQDFVVRRVEFSEHISKDRSKPPSLLVTYYCEGGRIFNEWICLEHTGYARQKAKSTWRLLAEKSSLDPDDIPATVLEALEVTPYLQSPTAIRVLMKKFPDVIGYSYTPHPQSESPSPERLQNALHQELREENVPF